MWKEQLSPTAGYGLWHSAGAWTAALLGHGLWQLWRRKLPHGRPLPAGTLPHLFGHRGCRLGHHADAETDKHPPENTLEAFRYALDSGADGFELDTRMTKDGKPVVFHDARVGRCLAHDGSNPLVSDMSLEQLQQLPYKQDKSLCVHTLEEAVELASKRGSQIMIETKDMRRQSELAAQCVDLIRKYDMLDQAMVISFDPISLYHVRREDPAVRTCFLWTPGLMSSYAMSDSCEALSPVLRMMAPIIDFFLDWCSHPALLPTFLGVSAIGPSVEWGLATGHKYLDAAKQRGMMTYLWVVNEPEVRDDVYTLAPKGIFAYSTDRLWP